MHSLPQLLYITSKLFVFFLTLVIKSIKLNFKKDKNDNSKNIEQLVTRFKNSKQALKNK